jgi:antitoxin component YwqK of YwqJK toxin-antitoxin module
VNTRINYHENEIRGSIAYYDNNVKTGTWKYYDRTGKLIKKEKYEDGKVKVEINYNQ